MWCSFKLCRLNIPYGEDEPLNSDTMNCLAMNNWNRIIPQCLINKFHVSSPISLWRYIHTLCACVLFIKYTRTCKSDLKWRLNWPFILKRPSTDVHLTLSKEWSVVTEVKSFLWYGNFMIANGECHPGDHCWHDDVIKWKHFPRYWPFVRGIHRSPVNSPHKGQWRGALMFSLIFIRINGWVNNDEAGDLRRHLAHYDVTLMGLASFKIGAGTIPWLPMCKWRNPDDLNKNKNKAQQNHVHMSWSPLNEVDISIAMEIFHRWLIMF